MPVIIQYVVERDGAAKMTFASKQQADAYDKMLDVADMIEELITRSELVPADQIEALSLYLAQQKDELIQALQGKSKTAKPAKNAETVVTNDVEKSATVTGSQVAALASAA